MKKIIINIILILVTCSNIYSQYIVSGSQPVSLLNIQNTTTSPTSMTTVSLGIGAILYLINPIVLYEDKKIYMGITKELSVGFGKFGENRFAFEYSFVFTGNISHHARLSYKYDLLLKENIEPSHMLQGTGVLSPGAGYFTNFNKHGIFPELTFGYSIRNHKILIYPHIKIRHTFMFNKNDSDITDISFGIILGFANPFNDVNIKRYY
ncbi:MAG: hypothetical protein NTU73_14750 [Ignavibacteriae bacterium]|nr:hypothetical protein [Ignavibacteriota bacterium]